jgi:hypothetical protein
VYINFGGNANYFPDELTLEETDYQLKTDEYGEFLLDDLVP